MRPAHHPPTHTVETGTDALRLPGRTQSGQGSSSRASFAPSLSAAVSGPQPYPYSSQVGGGALYPVTQLGDCPRDQCTACF